MNENADKYLEDLAKKVIKDASIESPSFNFTDTLMSQVETLSSVHSTVYKPLITKKAWVLISVVFICALAYIIMGNSVTSSGWFSSINLSALTNNKITNSFSGFEIPKTLAYSIGFLAFMICIQVTFLKHHFNKRFEA